MVSLISASTAERRRNCHGSYVLENRAPKQTSEYAREGIALHAVLQRMAEQNVEPAVGQVFEGVTFTQEMLEKVDDVWEKFVEFELTHDIDPKSVLFESQVQVGRDMVGRLDYAAWSRHGYPVVADFKFGFQPVDPVENAQLGFYAAGMAKRATGWFSKAGHVLVAILQPNQDVAEWQMPMDWLKRFTKELQATAAKIRKGDETRQIGPWCRYCLGRPVCPEQTETLVQIGKVEPAFAELTAERLSELLILGEHAVSYYEVLRTHALAEARRGLAIPHYKLIKSIGNRQFSDVSRATQLAKKAVGEDAFDVKLKTPAQLEKMYKQHSVAFDELDALIIRPERGTRLVPSAHPGKEVKPVEKFELPDNLQHLRGE